MAQRDPMKAPTKDERHEALEVFLGSWEAEGISYGGTDQSASDPEANGVPSTSTHTGRWHTGGFFLIQDEKALPGGETFDTLSVTSVDPETGGYVARTFENHGFYRRYEVTVDGDVWRLSGETERATIEFGDDDRTQTVVWEWKPEGVWLPLCDRVARRLD